jgi:hypothetical protein
MSSAVAAARKRRAGIQSAPTMLPPQNNPVGQSNPNGGVNGPPQAGLTIQQVIHVINSRLLTLENAEKERKDRESLIVPFTTENENTQTDPLQDDEIEIPIGEILSDYNQRFELLTQELADLKNLILKLQSYTMDVNRTLLEDRFVIPAGVSDQVEPNIVLSTIVDEPCVVEDSVAVDPVDDKEVIDAPLAPVVSGNKKKGSGKHVVIET